MINRMAMMQRWSPSVDLRLIESTLDRFWRPIGGDLQNKSTLRDAWTIPLDVIEDANAVHVAASMPGMTPEAISVTIENNILTIQATIEDESEDESEDERPGYVLRERRHGGFYRALRLPQSVEVGETVSRHEDGVLHITIPKREEAKAKRIEVKVGT